MSAIEVKKINTLTGHKDCLYTLEKYNDHQFFSAGGDGMVVIWDLKDPGTGQMVVQVPSSVYALSYHPHRNLLVVGQNFSGIHLVDIAKRKEVGSLALTKSAIFDIKTTNDAIYVGTGNGELIEVAWDLVIKNRITLSDKSIRAIAVHEERRQVAAGSSDCHIRILNDNLELLHNFKAHEISVFTLRYHPHLPLLLSGSRDARIRMWDIDKNFKLVEQITGHLYAVNHLDFSPDGKHFVTCSMDKSIKIWDAYAFKLLKVIDKARHSGHATSVNKLVWMNYRNWLVSCSDDRTVSLWDINFDT